MGEGGRGGGESPGDYKAGRTLISFQQEGNRCMKLFELNFFKRKTFLQMIKPAGQNHPHSQSIFLVLCQAVVKPLGGRCISPTQTFFELFTQSSSTTNVCRSQGNIPCLLFAHVLITKKFNGYWQDQRARNVPLASTDICGG